MHLHAHSNHNGSSHPASLQWHVAQAARSGTDVLWWSEHAAIFGPPGAARLVLPEGSWAFDGLDLVLADSLVPRLLQEGRKGVERLRGRSRGEGCEAEMRDGYLYARARGGENAGAPATLAYRPEAREEPLHLFDWTPPLARNVIAEAEIDWTPGGSGSRAYFEFLLSWHDYGRPVQCGIRYDLVSEGMPREVNLDSGAVRVALPVPTGRSRIVFDVADAARSLRDGTDGCVQTVQWGVEAEDGDSASLGLRSLEMRGREDFPGSYIATVRKILDGYREEYGVDQAIGVEVAIPRIHMNGFLPDPAVVLRLEEEMQSEEALKDWVSRVHARGGLTSYNHPFGALMGLLPGDPNVQAASRVVSDGLAIVDARAYGADILEVGYVERALPLRAHLDLWDFITARGLFLYGNGTSDSHGGLWFQGSGGNWFHTWVWASDPSQASLIRGMRNGRMFFGDLARWQGKFDFWIGPRRCGDRVRCVEGAYDLRVLLDPLPDRAVVRMVQGRIGGDPLSVEYVHRGAVIDPNGTTLVRVDGPCFVRLEVWLEDAAGGPEVPLLFSNPIVFFQG
jgi:hypothetical protein